MGYLCLCEGLRELGFNENYIEGLKELCYFFFFIVFVLFWFDNL